MFKGELVDTVAEDVKCLACPGRKLKKAFDK